MTTKEYLQQIHKLDIIIEQKRSEFADLRTMAASIGGFNYSAERVQSSPSGAGPYTKSIEKIVDMENEVEREIDKFLKLRHRIINQIQSLDNPDEIKILYKRYVQCRTFNQIVHDTGYSRRKVFLLHDSGINSFFCKFALDCTLDM